MASRWGCILLIDEADVFLEARQTENFDRNSLVAGTSSVLSFKQRAAVLRLFIN